MRAREPRHNEIPPALLALFHQANQAYNARRYAEAAPLFVTLSETARQTNRPRRAVQLRLRAADSYGRAGNKEMALAEAQKVLQFVQRRGQPEQLAHVMGRVVAVLEELGWSAEAATLQQKFGVGRVIAQPAVAQRRLQLPAQCPHCLGPVRSDEVEWIDNRSAACAYCGGTIRAGDE